MKDKRTNGGHVIPFPGTGRTPSNGATGPERAPDGSGETHYADPLLTIKKRSAFVRRAMLALPAWITPNGVTVFRALLIVPIVWLLRDSAYVPALLVLGFAMLLDFVDGALAEARNQKTELGAFLDPLSDKVLVCGTLLALVDRLPAAFGIGAAAVLLIALALTGIRLIKMARGQHGTARPSIAAKPAGKLKLVAETASMLLIVGGLAAASPTVVWIGGAMLAIAIWFALGSLKAQLLG